MTLLAKSTLLPSVPTLFNDFFDDDRFWSPGITGWMNKVPAANVVENENEFSVELAAPGMTKKDFKVDIENGQLCISSEKKDEKEEDLEHYTRKEFSYSSFSRSFFLPESIDEEKIKAKYADGVLKISLPKRAEAQQKQKRKAITVG